jgi:hypothetical protein
MGSHYVYNIDPYIHIVTFSVVYGLQILDLAENAGVFS